MAFVILHIRWQWNKSTESEMTSLMFSTISQLQIQLHNKGHHNYIDRKMDNSYQITKF